MPRWPRVLVEPRVRSAPERHAAAEPRPLDVLDRERERAAIDELLAAARAGGGGALVLRGEPGVGLTALLDHAADARGGMRVVRIRGVEVGARARARGACTSCAPRCSTGSTRCRPASATRSAAAFGLREGGTGDRLLTGLGRARAADGGGERRAVAVRDRRRAVARRAVRRGTGLRGAAARARADRLRARRPRAARGRHAVRRAPRARGRRAAGGRVPEAARRRPCPGRSTARSATA